MTSESDSRLHSGPERRRELRTAEKKQLLDALKAIEPMANPGRRQVVLEELREVHAYTFDPARFSTSDPSVLEILNRCLDLDAMRELVEVLELLVDDEADAAHVSALARLVDELLPGSILRPAQRQRLAELIGSLPRTDVEALLRHPRLASFVRFSANEVADGVEAGRRLEDLGAGTAGPPPLLVFLELIAHKSRGHQEIELHQLIHDVRSELGRVAEVRTLCRKLQDESESENRPENSESDLSPAPAVTIDNRDLGSGVDVNSNATPATKAASILKPPTVWGGVPPRNSRFTGREHLVGELRAHLERDDAPSALLQNALYGLGGVGKTQLALEYTYRFQSEYQLVWWIPADDELLVIRSLASLSRRLELPQREDAQDNVEAALDALRQDPRYRRWLLVFDNAEDPDIVRRYLPSGPGHVLITSRSRQWESETHAMEVDVFLPEESLELLMLRWPGLSSQDGLRLAERLGHLPLALDQAAAFHEQTGIQLEEYLASLDESAGHVLAEGAAPGYPRSVAATFRLAFEQLQERSAVAAQLLAVCASISSHEIAISLLSRARGANVPSPLDSALRDDLQLRRAVGDLGRYALVQLDAGRDFITVHRLVAAVIRDTVPAAEKEALERGAHSVLAMANPGEPDRARNWAYHAQIAPHVLPSDIIFSADADARQVVLDQVRYLYDIGNFGESRKLGQLAVDTWRGRLGPDDVMTLASCRHLANTMRALGEYEQARTLDEDTLERAQRTLGDEHPHTLATALSFAADLRLKGDFPRAKALDDATLARHQRVLGEDDPGTLRAANNLGVDYRLLGDFRSALALDEDTVARRARVYRPDHRETLYSYGCVARDLYGLGRYAEALELQQEKLALYEKSLTVRDHGDLLYVRRNMAILLRKVGEHGQSYEWAVQIYDRYSRRFGRRHEHTLAAMVTLCNTLRVIGAGPSTPADNRGASLERAHELGAEALTTYRAVFGPDHPFTLACATDLAIVLRVLGQADEATALDSRTRTALERVLGPVHPYTLCSAANMTNNLAAAGLVDDAFALSKEVLGRSRQVRGEDHPLTLACATNLALDLAAVGQAAEAENMRTATRERLQVLLGRNHPETINMERGLRAESDIEPPAM